MEPSQFIQQPPNQHATANLAVIQPLTLEENVRQFQEQATPPSFCVFFLYLFMGLFFCLLLKICEISQLFFMHCDKRSCFFLVCFLSSLKAMNTKLNTQMIQKKTVQTKNIQKK